MKNLCIKQITCYVKLTKLYKILLAVIFGSLLSSCAQDKAVTDPSNSMVPSSIKQVDKKLNAEIEYIDFSENIRSEFGYRTLPKSLRGFYIEQWKKALVKVINDSKRFESDSPNKFALSVTILEMENPYFGTSPKFMVGALYQIKDILSGRIVYSNEIRTEGILPWSLFQGSSDVTIPKVLVIAVNRNIKEFMDFIDIDTLQLYIDQNKR